MRTFNHSGLGWRGGVGLLLITRNSRLNLFYSEGFNYMIILPSTVIIVASHKVLSNVRALTQPKTTKAM